MKKTKKMLALAFSTLLLLTLFAGCGGEAQETEAPEATQVSVTEAPVPVETTVPAPEPAEITEEPVSEISYPLVDEETTMSMFFYYPPWLTGLTDDVAEIGYFQQMKALTGVTMEFEACSLFVVEETFGIMSASEDWTDLVYGFSLYYGDGLDNAVNNEVIYALNGFMEQGFMPNYESALNVSDSVRLDATTDEGHIAVAARILSEDYMPNAGMVMRGDYLEKIGMESPETYEEWHDVLAAFKTELGIASPLNIPYYGSFFGDYLGAGYGVATYVFPSGDLPFYVVDGEVRLGVLEDGYYQWLSTMAQWYEEGLIYQDFMSATDVMHYPADERVLQGEIGIWYCDIDTMATYAPLATDPDFVVVGVSDPVQNKGDVNHLRKYSDATANLVDLDNGLAMTTACENPELGAMWMDSIYSEQGHLICNYGGVEGETFHYNDEGKPVLGELITNNPDMVFNWAISYYCQKNFAGVYEYSRLSDVHTEEQKEATAIWNKADAAYGYPTSANLNVEETEIYNSKAMDMNTYISEYVVKFITGEVGEDYYDTFRETILSMGAEELIACKQAAYDRYINRTI